MNLSFTRTEYENIKKSKELDEFSPAQFHSWINSNEDLFMKGESGEFDNDLQKSEYNTLQNELAAFAKVEVWEEDKQSTIVKSEYFIREKQVDFTDEITKSENGEDETITKGIYRDTALNRKLGRVGAEFGSQIEKSRAGTYEDTPENRKLGRVGQKYGESKKEDKQNDTTLRDLETKLNYAKDFSPHKVGYYEQLIKEHKEKSNPKESTEKKEETVGSGVHKKGDKLEHNGETIHVGHDTSGGQSTITYKAPSVSDKTYYDLDKLKKVIEDSKESTNKKEDGKKEKISPKSIRLGDSYMAYEAGNPDAKPEKVKIISRKRDEGGYFDTEVEYENGEKDKWYLSDKDFIFEKI